MTTQPTPKTKRRRYTRREFLKNSAHAILAGTAAAGALTTVPALASQAESPADSTPPATQPSHLSDGHVLNVQTVATVPNRADIVDPATLADYCTKMESHLVEQAQRVESWAADGDIPLREFLENQIYALLDSLAVTLLLVERAGYIKMAKEIILSEHFVEHVGVYHEISNQKARQKIMQEHLFGQVPPPMSEQLVEFCFFKTTIGQQLIDAIEQYQRNEA